MRILRILVFLLPTQLAYHFWPRWTYIFGIRVDYFAPAIYLTDILVLVFVIASFSKNREILIQVLSRGKIYVVLIAFFSLSNIIASIEPLLAFFKWMKILEFTFFAMAISISKFDFKKDISRPLTFSVLLISLIGILQFFKGGSIGGIFYFLGERTFNQSMPGIALSQIFGREHLRPYSIFSHPNSFAGYLIVSLVLLLGHKVKKKKDRALILITFGISVIPFIFIYSLGSFLAILVLIFLALLLVGNKANKTAPILFLFGCIGISLLMAIYSNEILNFHFASTSISERLWLNTAAGVAFASSPTLGVGLNNFILAMTKMEAQSVVVWKLQPVHNIFLLIISETGLFGLLLFSQLLYKSITHAINNKLVLLSAMFAIILTGMFDHYWLTLQQNQLLLAFVVGLTFNTRSFGSELTVNRGR